MVKSKSDAKSNYRESIEDNIGAYRNASGANSISDAAETLESAFNTGDSLSASSMADNWAKKY